MDRTMKSKPYDYTNIYPRSRRADSITSAEVFNLSPEEEAMFAVFQGLVNRDEPRAYLCFRQGTPDGPRADLQADHLWVDYYETRFGINVTRLTDPYRLFDVFPDVVQGVIIYDPRLIDTLNLAVMQCGRRNCLPVTPQLQRKLKTRFAWARDVADDLRGRFKNGYELNLWAHENIQPTCDRHIIAHQCGNVPYLYDYVVCHNLFLFHTSSSMKDRREVALMDKVLQAMDRPCHVMGWFDSRGLECEYPARVATNGCFITCNHRAPNLSLHSAIDVKPRYKARRLTASHRKVERRVYVAIVISDGDALWCMNSFFVGSYDQKQLGRMPLTWEVQPLTYHLAPGQLQYYFETMTDNDYPMAAVSGAGYTYPNLHPDPASYMRFSEGYMKRTGLRYIYAGFSSPYHATYWLDPESHFNRTVAQYREHVPSAKGIVKGYGGGGLMADHAIQPGKTPVVCATLSVDKRKDILAEIAGATEQVDQRPCFILVHVRQGTPVESLVDVAATLGKQGHEFLLVDEWFAKLNSAVEKGWLDRGMYANRQELIDQATRQARKAWCGNLRRDFERTLRLSTLPNRELEKRYKTFPRMWGDAQPVNEKKRTVTTLTDDLAFSVLFTAQVMAGLVAGGNGFHRHDLAALRAFFKTRMKHLKDAEVLAECMDAWLKWETKPVATTQAKAWARRMLKLLPRIDRMLRTT